MKRETSLPQEIKDLLSDDEVIALETLPLVGKGRHPTWYSVYHPVPAKRDRDTNCAVRSIANESGGCRWLDQLKPELVKWQAPESASSALAEARAYGQLLEANFKVSPVSRAKNGSTPDFIINGGDGDISVEVFAKHQDARAKSEFSEVSFFKTRGAQVETTLSVVAPGGAPDPDKVNDSVQANVISRVCGVKSEEQQWAEDKPAILWIDFQSFSDLPEVIDAKQAAPLIAGSAGLTSGALWYAFYGWKGAPIFEEDFFPRDRVVQMGHDGRFRQTGDKKSKLSACVVRLTDATILFENPWANKSLPDLARRHLLLLPDFDLGLSVCEWTKGDAELVVDLGKRQIETLYQYRQRLNRG